MGATNNDLGIQLLVYNDFSIPCPNFRFTGKYVSNWFLTPCLFVFLGDPDPGLFWSFCLDGIDGSGVCK